MTRTHIPILHKKKEDKPRSRLTRGGRIKPVSAKMAKISKIYRALKLQFLEEHPYCQHYIQEHKLMEKEVIDLDGSGVMRVPADSDFISWYMQRHVVPRSVQVHHKKGRGKYHLDVSSWMAVSAEGHAQIHADPETAYRKGYMLPRN
jgi:hypothetical protein